ncbi:YheC/YheD family protein [Paenibacillus sp. MMO-177]|uniref:YheC/YheD family protein n=1 Tax=Paenibacillus sp. MMO-177 TaxID=3081289 RepID=UPI003015E651
MKGYMIKYPGRKWLKHVALSGEDELRDYLPDTEQFTPKGFIGMIDRYPVLFVKPDLGMQGQGVMKVYYKDDRVVIRTENSRYSFQSAKFAAIKLKQLIGTKRYIMQQGIDLIKINGNPIDFRILLHLRRDETWKFFGIMGKMAAPNRFVTNHSSGGKAIQLHRALGLTKQECEPWEKKLGEIALQIAQGMKKHFPLITELGLDIAIDTEHRVWLLEANTKPQFQLFRHHSNPKLYAQIANSVKNIRREG